MPQIKMEHILLSQFELNITKRIRREIIYLINMEIKLLEHMPLQLLVEMLRNRINSILLTQETVEKYLK